MAAKATAKASAKTTRTVSLDSVAGKLADSGVNLTDAERERVGKLSKDSDTLAAVEQVLSERVGPAAASVQDYPDVYDLMGRDDPTPDDDTERPTGVHPSASVEEAAAAGAAVPGHPQGTETVQSDGL